MIKKNQFDNKCDQLIEEIQRAQKQMLQDPTVEHIESHAEVKNRTRAT